ncbi:MAG: cyclase family protein [Christensenellaceae bacterium]|nr:cyclase family protein [Christensenellaceae bacterium]
MKIYDLSLPLSVTDPVFPGTPGMAYEHTQLISKDHYNLGLVHVNTHAGTHTDAPLHFIEGGTDLAAVDPGKYVGPAYVVECTDKGAFDVIDVSDVEPHAENIVRCRRVIFKTGWSKQFGRPEYFTDYPVISLELARWLTENGIVMVGVEPPSLNPALYIEVHQTLLEGGVAVVEGLTNLDCLPSQEIFFCGAPIALVEGDGFPIRALAIEF